MVERKVKKALRKKRNSTEELPAFKKMIVSDSEL